MDQGTRLPRHQAHCDHTINASVARTMEVAAKQAGTSVEMLQRVYHQANPQDRAELMVSLAERRERR